VPPRQEYAAVNLLQPPQKIAFRTLVAQQPSQVLSWHPRVVLLPAFLGHDRCDRVINVTRAKGLAKSPVLAEPGGKGYADEASRGEGCANARSEGTT
jgi:hypothetical protein